MASSTDSEWKHMVQKEKGGEKDGKKNEHRESHLDEVQCFI